MHNFLNQFSTTYFSVLNLADVSHLVLCTVPVPKKIKNEYCSNFTPCFLYILKVWISFNGEI